MRAACASGNLAAVQSACKLFWLDLPEPQRIDKNIFGSSGWCEAIQRDDAVVAEILLSNIWSFNDGHVTRAAESGSYAVVQLFLDHGWDINSELGRLEPPGLS